MNLHETWVLLLFVRSFFGPKALKMLTFSSNGTALSRNSYTRQLAPITFQEGFPSLFLLVMWCRSFLQITSSPLPSVHCEEPTVCGQTVSPTVCVRAASLSFHDNHVCFSPRIVNGSKCNTLYRLRRGRHLSWQRYISPQITTESFCIIFLPPITLISLTSSPHISISYLQPFPFYHSYLVIFTRITLMYYAFLKHVGQIQRVYVTL